MSVQISYKKPALEIYRFGKVTDGNAAMKNALGGKGANLAEMSLLNLPIPSGFTLPCSASLEYLNLEKNQTAHKTFHIKTLKQIQEGVLYLKSVYGHIPLLSVRSGARVSMPGMMDTILNCGITRQSYPFWREKLGRRAALDSFRRFIMMYSSVVLGIDIEDFKTGRDFLRNNLHTCSIATDCKKSRQE